MGRTLTKHTQRQPVTATKSKSKEKRATYRDMDYTFLLIIVIMVCFGLIMVLSASTPAANAKVGNSYQFFNKQLVSVCIGLAAMFTISRFDYRIWKKYTKLFMIICTILLILVLIPGIGMLFNGSRRWIQLPGFQLQPSEFMKLAIGMYFAAMIEKGGGKITKVRGMMPYFAWIGVVALLMMMETHLSGTLVIVGIAIVVMIVGGAPFWFFALMSAPGALGVFALAMLSPNKRARMISFLNPFQDIKNTGWQVVQSLYAIGSGGIFGLGLGQSRQKYTYLPEPYNDFIFSVICEELGLLGAILVIALFMGFIIRGIKIAMEAPDTFGSLMVVGIVAQVAIQAILNIAVATSSIPNTGISLPFFSYGGTAIVILLAEMGLVLSVSRYGRK
ncbi:MAG: putative lipid II flippase FtsW [Clostridia bacterium]|nr:putative lipid II flippase FtsW [Clostridia bacterium]